MCFSSQELLVMAADVLYEMGKCSQSILSLITMIPYLTSKNSPWWEGEI